MSDKSSREKLKTLTIKEIADIYKRVFCTPDGELVLADLKTHSFAGQSTHAYDSAGRYDPYASAVNAERKFFIERILNIINNE
jgi:hypothetical protein